MVGTRHAVILNPAASVRAQRYQVVEGKTPEISVEQARRLLKSIDTGHVVGLRDRAIIGILVYTAARVGAVAKLRMRDYFDAGDQYCLRFAEKGGKSREIPVRHDLQQFLSGYVASAGISSKACRWKMSSNWLATPIRERLDCTTAGSGG